MTPRESPDSIGAEHALAAFVDIGAVLAQAAQRGGARRAGGTPDFVYNAPLVINEVCPLPLAADVPLVGGVGLLLAAVSADNPPIWRVVGDAPQIWSIQMTIAQQLGRINAAA